MFNNDTWYQNHGINLQRFHVARNIHLQLHQQCQSLTRTNLLATGKKEIIIV